ncbi:hypothetical protein KC333_g158 [Hortaea werneckii]|nr:hypothetical protein KC333_g158 [Hortaea werneckii]
MPSAAQKVFMPSLPPTVLISSVILTTVLGRKNATDYASSREYRQHVKCQVTIQSCFLSCEELDVEERHIEADETDESCNAEYRESYEGADSSGPSEANLWLQPMEDNRVQNATKTGSGRRNTDSEGAFGCKTDHHKPEDDHEAAYPDELASVASIEERAGEDCTAAKEERFDAADPGDVRVRSRWDERRGYKLYEYKSNGGQIDARERCLEAHLRLSLARRVDAIHNPLMPAGTEDRYIYSVLGTACRRLQSVPEIVSGSRRLPKYASRRFEHSATSDDGAPNLSWLVNNASSDSMAASAKSVCSETPTIFIVTGRTMICW